MFIRTLTLGFALFASSVVLAPAASLADASVSQRQYEMRANNLKQRQARIARRQAYEEKFKDLRMKRWKRKVQFGKGGEVVGVPELDPSGLAAGASLLLGGLLVAQGRKRRLLLA